MSTRLLKSVTLWDGKDLAGATGKSIRHIPRNSHIMGVVQDEKTGVIKLYFTMPENSVYEDRRIFHLIQEGAPLSDGFAYTKIGTFSNRSTSQLFLVIEELSTEPINTEARVIASAVLS